MTSQGSTYRSSVTDKLASFVDRRGRLMGIAYRMLGSVTDAEDVLQEAYLRWNDADSASVRSDWAYLSTVVTRLCIDRLRALKRERETYVGPWLPEPWLHGDEVNEHRADLSTGFLLLLEKLQPEVRAAFVLREAFDMDYADIGRMLEMKPATCRQWCRRARQRLAAEHEPRPFADEQRDLFRAFLAALETADADAAIRLLTEDAVVYADGGGVVSAALVPVTRRDRIAQVLIHLRQRQLQSYSVRPARINGSTGLLGFVDGKLDHVVTGETREGRIHRIYVVRNPEKLAHVQP